MTQGARQLAKMFPAKTGVAKRLGISPAYLSKLISGTRPPSMRVAGRIQKELGIPVEAWTR